MDVREKLVEMLKTSPTRNGYTDIEDIADHLIANGVTVSDEIEELRADNNRLRNIWAKAVSDLSKATANGVTVQEWISVSERLPGDDETVLCYRAQDDMRVAELLCGYKVQNDAQTCNHSNRKDVAPFINREWNMIFTATHWLPIPELPKEG